MIFSRIFTVTCILLIAITSSVQAKGRKKTDIKGSKDHPLVQRYKDSYIKSYQYTDFDEFQLATGPKPPKQKTPIRKVSGEITTIIYKTNDSSHSVAKILKNFDVAFQQAGVNKLFSCANKECGSALVKQTYTTTPRKRLYIDLDPWNIDKHSDFRYWNGVLKKGGKNIYIALVIESKSFGNFPATIALDIIEEAAVKTGLVTLNPNFVKEQLKTEGRVILSGINFELDSATLTEDSNSSLKTIAKFLADNPKQNVYIVGHTDNQGKYGYNKSLSERRAIAVVYALKNRFKIKENRLTPIGVADVAPIASNASKDGKAKNRRVEMVSR